jgi:acetyl/propionyl-CoA carboxylase alpha subunit
MPGVRIDSGVTEGDTISVHYDPLIVKVIASGETRERTIVRLAAALRAFPILGVHTNVPFLLRILEHPDFRAGSIDTGFLDRESASLSRPGPEVPEFVRAALRRHDDAPGPGPAGHSSWDPWSA